MKPLQIAAFALLVSFGIAPSLASAKQYRYLGQHPIHHGHGGTFCYIEFPHVHTYAPANANVLYRDKDGWHHFVGDPVAHGFDGKKHAFYGAHPIHPHHVVLGVDIEPDVTPEIHWCYLKGPHFHGFAPPAEAKFEIKGDTHWFVGVYPPVFYKHKPRYVAINPLYARIKYPRPVIEVVAPPAYLDVLVVGPGGKRGVVHGHFKAGIWVNVPVPSVEISIGGPPRRRWRRHPGKFEHKVKRKGRGFEEKYEYKSEGGKVKYEYKYESKGGWRGRGH